MTIRREVSNNGKPTFAQGSIWIRIGGTHVDVLALLLDNVGRIKDARVEYERLANEYPYQWEAHEDRLEAANSAAELGRMDIARPEYESVAAVWGSTDATSKSFNYEKWFGDPAIARKLLTEGKAGGFRSKAEMECLNWFLDARSSGARPAEHEIDVACASGAGGYDGPPQYIYGYFGYADAALREMNARVSSIFGKLESCHQQEFSFVSIVHACRTCRPTLHGIHEPSRVANRLLA